MVQCEASMLLITLVSKSVYFLNAEDPVVYDSVIVNDESENGSNFFSLTNFPENQGFLQVKGFSEGNSIF